MAFNRRRPSPAGVLPGEETDGTLRKLRERFFRGPAEDDREELKRLNSAEEKFVEVKREQCINEEVVIDEDLGTAFKLAPGSLKREDVATLVATLTEWMNEKLTQRRIVVQSLFEDMYDGQVLMEFLEIMTGEAKQPTPERLDVQRGMGDLNMPTRQRRGRLQLAQALEWVDRLLGTKRSASGEDELKSKWTPSRIYAKEVVATLHLIVALARYFNCRKPLPNNVIIELICVERQKDRMRQSIHYEQITADEGALAQAKAYRGGPTSPRGGERDAFDKLFDQAPERVEGVKSSLLSFVNKHLSKVSWVSPLEDIGSNFEDGILLIQLLAVLGGYFVPLCEYYTRPVGRDLNHMQKIKNVGTAFRLMSDGGMEPKGLPDDVVNGDLKATLRTLYTIFSVYKTTS